MARAFNLARNARSLLARPEQGHFHVLDGLRAIAIFWVIAFHMTLAMALFDPSEALRARSAFMWTRWGSFGVDMFFVVSGFIIGYLLMKERQQTGSVDIRGFYWRRILRLLPAYYLSMLLCAAIVPANIEYAWANILYVNNLLPVQHQYMNWSWSLAIEEQFYILFPALLLLFARTRMRWLLFGVGMALALLVRIAIVEHYRIQIPVLGHDDQVYRANYDLLYDKLYTRYGALLLGVGVAYYYLKDGLSRPLWKRREWRLFVAALSIASFIPALVTPDVTEPHRIQQPYYYAFWVIYPYVFAFGIACLLLLSLGAHAERSLGRRILAARVWYPFAQLSYAAYLIHPLVIGIVLFTIYDPVKDSLPTPTAYLAGLGLYVLIFIVAALIYLGIERPFMNLRYATGPRAAARVDVRPAAEIAK